MSRHETSQPTVKIYLLINWLPSSILWFSINILFLKHSPNWFSQLLIVVSVPDNSMIIIAICWWNSVQQSPILIFSRNSTIASVRLSVTKSPQPLRITSIKPIDDWAYRTIKPIDHQAYWPSSLLTIECLSIRQSVTKTPQPLRIAPIDPWAFWLLSLSTIKPIDHRAYQPSSLSTIEPIYHRAYQPLSLLFIQPINHQAYRLSSLLTIKPINHQACRPLVFFCDF